MSSRLAPSAAKAAARRDAGARAEAAAAAHLEANGFVVIARNVRVGRLEVDLVAREADVVAIVEVRTRGDGSWQRALDSIDDKKRRHLRTAGERLWQRRFSKDHSLSRLRFDAVTVAFDARGQPTIEHIKGFFV